MSTSEIAVSYTQLIEKILAHFAGETFKDEVRLAKSEFFDNAGILDEQSEAFELRMSQFFDWYLFTRDLIGYGQTPLDVVYMTRELRFTDHEKEMIEHLKNHRHGVYEFIKFKNNDITIKDLIKNEKIVIKDSPWNFGFDPEELFEVRLIPYEDSWLFTKGFCFHPADAKKYILGEVKKLKKNPDLNPDDLLLKFLKMRYKFERYRHVKVDMIYTNDTIVGS
jgi:hypothetical protein